jgi:hypothetical protein
MDSSKAKELIEILTNTICDFSINALYEFCMPNSSWFDLDGARKKLVDDMEDELYCEELGAHGAALLIHNIDNGLLEWWIAPYVLVSPWVKADFMTFNFLVNRLDPGSTAHIDDEEILCIIDHTCKFLNHIIANYKDTEHDFASLDKDKISITLYRETYLYPEIIHNIARVNKILLDEIANKSKNQKTAVAEPELFNNGSNNHYSPIRWIAPDNAFADLIVELVEKGYIAAATKTEALNIAAPHFTDVNRDGDILLQGLNNKAYLGTGRGKASFSGIPAASELNPKKPQGNFSSIPRARRRRGAKAETK